jgi:DNA-binding transcriptional ArsR family regulator
MPNGENGVDRKGEPGPTGLAREGVLTTLFGSHSRTRILVALLSEDWHDVPASKIADLADLHRSTVNEQIKPLVELGVVEDREAAGAKLYRINRDSELAKLVKRTEEALLDRQSELAGEGDETVTE